MLGASVDARPITLGLSAHLPIPRPPSRSTPYSPHEGDRGRCSPHLRVAGLVCWGLTASLRDRGTYRLRRRGNTLPLRPAPPSRGPHHHYPWKTRDTRPEHRPQCEGEPTLNRAGISTHHAGLSDDVSALISSASLRPGAPARLGVDHVGVPCASGSWLGATSLGARARRSAPRDCRGVVR